MEVGSYTIRPPRADDATAFADVHAQSWRETYEKLLPRDGIAEFEATIRGGLWADCLAAESPVAVVVAVNAHDAPVGFVMCGPAQDPSLNDMAEIYAIYVLRNAQRCGLGARLFAAAQEHLRAKDYRALGLWVINGNVDAEAFYRRMGGNPERSQVFTMAGQEVSETLFLFPL